MDEVNQQNLDDDLELYKMVVDQVRHEHKRWVDNFAILLTWNTIILVIVVSLMTSTFLGGAPSDGTQSPVTSHLASSTRIVLFLLSGCGAAVAFVTGFVMRRFDTATALWFSAIRDCEKSMKDAGRFSLEKLPFTSIYEKFNGEVKDKKCPCGIKGTYLHYVVCGCFFVLYISIAGTLAFGGA